MHAGGNFFLGMPRSLSDRVFFGGTSSRAITNHMLQNHLRTILIILVFLLVSTYIKNHFLTKILNIVLTSRVTRRHSRAIASFWYYYFYILMLSFSKYGREFSTFRTRHILLGQTAWPREMDHFLSPDPASISRNSTLEYKSNSTRMTQLLGYGAA